MEEGRVPRGTGSSLVGLFPQRGLRDSGRATPLPVQGPRRHSERWSRASLRRPPPLRTGQRGFPSLHCFAKEMEGPGLLPVPLPSLWGEGQKLEPAVLGGREGRAGARAVEGPPSEALGPGQPGLSLSQSLSKCEGVLSLLTPSAGDGAGGRVPSWESALCRGTHDSVSWTEERGQVQGGSGGPPPCRQVGRTQSILMSMTMEWNASRKVKEGPRNLAVVVGNSAHKN